MSKAKKHSFSSDEERINQEASDWLANQDRNLTPEEQDAFFDWLAENPLHSAAFNKRKSIFRAMDVLAEWKPEHSSEPNPDLLAVSKSKSKLVWFSIASGIAAVLAIGLYVGGLLGEQSQSEAILLASGQSAEFYESHVINDGSVVELNRGGQVSVRFSDDKRLVDLLSGEAHFTVAKDARRPFVVRANGTVVQAVGTEFNVLMNSGEVEVIVTEGQVLINPSIATTRESIIVESEPMVRALNAGQRSIMIPHSKNAPPLIEQVSQETVDKRLAWRNEVLDFTEAPLSDVILEFNRRNRTQLVIGDPALNDLPISAVFHPNNPDEFVELLEIIGDVRAERNGESKIILWKNTH